MPIPQPLPGGSVTSPLRFLAAAVHAGLKDGDALDLALLVSETPCAAAGVFTQNRVRAAPVLYDEALLNERPGRVRGVVMNARVANACTGEAGLAAAGAMARSAESALQLPSRSMLVLSTGVIGVPLPLDRITAGIAVAAPRVAPGGGPDAARAIMTTDTRPKQLAVSVETGGGTVTVGGMAKGAGMIHPNMATMLAVLTTDAAVEVKHLRELLRRVTDRTFNATSVDGDTSTNDTVLLLANGASGVELARDVEGTRAFDEAVGHVARELALMIVQDGEGATRFVEIIVVGATTEAMARDVGRAIARSSLVKTAVAGGDPNWGRVLAAAGASGLPVVPERLGLAVQRRAEGGGPAGEWLVLARASTPAPYDEADARAVFNSPSICLRLDLGMGGAEGTVWTCDLSEQYVRVNAHYRS
ncbi:MAG TPA: bifunctional glutamate N-acetyltransferase/amino-acid acetyltransferase ArgJ [Gemmatimonadales bacterium]|nr:bifunctional glutamate N-acetyltransferase/amino-acid acetyltransferase ArgJ [Gemmatimonadales bacterium]